MGVANYQFGEDSGSVLFAGGVRVSCSRRTGRIRHVFRDGKLIATLKPKGGYLALTPLGGLILLEKRKATSNVVVIQDDVRDFIEAGGDVFAKHVVRASIELRPVRKLW